MDLLKIVVSIKTKTQLFEEIEVLKTNLNQKEIKLIQKYSSAEKGGKVVSNYATARRVFISDWIIRTTEDFETAKGLVEKKIFDSSYDSDFPQGVKLREGKYWNEVISNLRKKGKFF